MAKVLTGISGNLISAASAGFAPTNSADVSAIASAYQVVSATGTKLYNGTYYLTSVNGNQLSAKYAVSASSATAAFYARYDRQGGIVRSLSSLPGSAEVSAIASAYAESAASGKQDELTFSYDDDKISAINGSALAGQGGGGGSVVSPSGTIIVTDGTAIEATNSAIRDTPSSKELAATGTAYSVYPDSWSDFWYGYNPVSFDALTVQIYSGISADINYALVDSYYNSSTGHVFVDRSSTSFDIEKSGDNIRSIRMSSNGYVNPSGSSPISFWYATPAGTSVDVLAWTSDVPVVNKSGSYVTGINGNGISAARAYSASNASYANTAYYDSNGRPLTGMALKSDIGVVSPSGTVYVSDNNKIEGTNSAVLTGSVGEHWESSVTLTEYNIYLNYTTTLYNGDFPYSGLYLRYIAYQPNSDTIITSMSMSGNNEYSATSVMPQTATSVDIPIPGTSYLRVKASNNISISGGYPYTALVFKDPVVSATGVGELAWASALPTYSYDAEDKISAINGSAIAGGAGGVDSATVSAIASSYAESAVSSYQPLSGMSGYASAFSAGEGLEFVQSGSDQVLQVEAPVDIVAGPGIVIDNPDGNTLRVSQSTFGAWENITDQFTWASNATDNGVRCLYNSTLKLLWMQGYVHLNVGTSSTKVCTLPSSMKTQLRISELGMPSTLEEKHGLLSTNLDRTELHFKWVTVPSNKYVGFFLICPMEEV